jgi:hypothetical protein
MELTMNANEIESAIEHAINALSLAKLALSKSALPVFNESDVLRKALSEPMGDAAKRALDLLADAEKRMERLEAARDLEAQHAMRKTYTRFAHDDAN